MPTPYSERIKNERQTSKEQVEIKSNNPFRYDANAHCEPEDENYEVEHERGKK